MKYKREVLKPQLETVDVVCDSCGAKDSEYRKANHDDPMPRLILEGCFEDEEYHTSWICGGCYAKIIDHFNIKPLIKHYSLRGFGQRTHQRERMYVNLTDESDNRSIIDNPDGVPRYEKEEWQEADGKRKEPPVDKFREWARKFLDDLRDDEYYSGPPPEGPKARHLKHRIAEELRELFD